MREKLIETLKGFGITEELGLRYKLADRILKLFEGWKPPTEPVEKQYLTKCPRCQYYFYFRDVGKPPDPEPNYAKVCEHCGKAAYKVYENKSSPKSLEDVIAKCGFDEVGTEETCRRVRSWLIENLPAEKEIYVEDYPNIYEERNKGYNKCRSEVLAMLGGE